MSAHALAQGSLRPAEALPPTLLPNAIRSAAPHTDRGKSFIASCLIYVCGASAVVFLAKNPQLVKPRIATGHEVVVELNPTVVPETRALPPPPPLPQALQQQRDAMTTPPPAPLDTVPETPTELPSISRAHEVYSDPNASNNPVVIGPTSSTTTTRPSVTEQPRILEVSLSSLKVLHQVAPTYPPIARLAKVQGAVVMRMTIDEQGVPINVEVISTPHSGLNAESMRVAKLWRFEPAKLDGRPVSAQFHLTLNYRLSN
jgi:periplasmic protein TonB